MHRRKSLPAHPNGMTFAAYDADGAELLNRTYYSVGGGFVVDEQAVGVDRVVVDSTQVKYPFDTAADLLAHCEREGLRISDLMLANELSWRTADEVRTGLLELWTVMEACVRRRLQQRRRVAGRSQGAAARARSSRRLTPRTRQRSTRCMSSTGSTCTRWRSTRRTRPAGGSSQRRPTARRASSRRCCTTTRGSCRDADDDGIVRFLLTAAAIGILFKQNASISGAEVGCQGEVGSACSMAAGALCEVLGGTPEQVENAAEIGIEHNLGLTCDPVGGLVQIPCIERNAIASVKAINAARLALNGDRRPHRDAGQGDQDDARHRPRHARSSTRRQRAAGSPSTSSSAEDRRPIGSPR